MPCAQVSAQVSRVESSPKLCSRGIESRTVLSGASSAHVLRATARLVRSAREVFQTSGGYHQVVGRIVDSPDAWQARMSNLPDVFCPMLALVALPWKAVFVSIGAQKSLPGREAWRLSRRNKMMSILAVKLPSVSNSVSPVRLNPVVLEQLPTNGVDAA